MTFLGIRCKCIVDLAKDLDEKIERHFKQANHQEKVTIINLLGVYYWSGGHVHDGN